MKRTFTERLKLSIPFLFSSKKIPHITEHQQEQTENVTRTTGAVTTTLFYLTNNNEKKL